MRTEEDVGVLQQEGVVARPIHGSDALIQRLQVELLDNADLQHSTAWHSVARSAAGGQRGGLSCQPRGGLAGGLEAPAPHRHGRRVRA